MEQMLSKACGVQIFNALKYFIPWNQAIYILELRTHDNETTGFGLGHFRGIMISDKDERRMKKGKWADLWFLGTR